MSHWPYSTARWQRVRALQLAREPMCRLCTELGMTPTRPATDVDHRQPIAAGGAVYDMANLQSLCAEHHSWKTGTYDAQGKPWEEWERRGCFSDGSPRDPSHPWYSAPPCGDE